MFDLLRVRLQVRPPRVRRHPEHILGPVFIGIFRVRSRVIVFTSNQLRAMLRKRVRDVLEKDQAEYDVFVFGRVHVIAQLVGRKPELGFETDGGGGFGGLLCACFGATGHESVGEGTACDFVFGRLLSFPSQL